MNHRLFIRLLVSVAGATAFVRADPTDDAIVAAMKLSSAVNYSWTTTLTQNSHTAEIHGQTTADGYSLLTFKGFSGPSNASSAKPGEVNTVFQGDSKYVFESNGNWVTPSDKPATTTEPADSGKGTPTGGPGNSATRSRRGGRSASGGIGGMGGGRSSGQRRGASGGSDREAPIATAGSKLPSGVNLPHEELAIIASNYTGMHVADGVASGTLTEWGADQLLTPPGFIESPPDKAAGTFRLWIKDGAVTKYELKLTAETGPGGVTVKGGLAQTITVELTDVGTTAVTIPPAAKLKLGI